MNCSKCGSDVNVRAAWFVEPPETNAMVFCDEACVRAWMGPDRPLSRRLGEAELQRLSPQHIVVDRQELLPGEDETTAEWVRRLKLTLVFA